MLICLVQFRLLLSMYLLIDFGKATCILAF